jgi:ribosomal protein L19E
VTGASSGERDGDLKRCMPDDDMIDVLHESGNSTSQLKKTKTQQQREPDSGKGKGKEKQRTRGGPTLILRQYLKAAAPRLNEDSPEGQVITKCFRRYLTAARKEDCMNSCGPLKSR